MDYKERIGEFADELSLIMDDDIRGFAMYGLSKLPDYFFTIPASSTGKYHPAHSLGEGGLVRHTKAAARIAHSLLSKGMLDIPNPKVADCIIAALILHDGAKSGIVKGKYTVTEHPKLVCDLIENNISEDETNVRLDEIPKLNKAQREFIYDLIRSHMGQWNKDRDGREVLPMPKNRFQSFVHMCDYLSSRKFLIFDFHADYKA